MAPRCESGPITDGTLHCRLTSGAQKNCNNSSCRHTQQPEGHFRSVRRKTKVVSERSLSADSGSGSRLPRGEDGSARLRRGAPWLCSLALLLPALLNVAPEASAFIPDFIEWGYCSRVQLQDDFDPVKYQGMWWDVLNIPNEYQKATSCIMQNISWTGAALEVSNEGLSAEGDKVHSFARMTPAYGGARHSAHMSVDAVGVPAAPYQVLATDYTRYSCVYSCLQFPGVFAEFFWVFGRTPTLPQDVQQICLDKFKQSGINTDKLQKVEQGEGCPYYSHLPALEGYNSDLLGALQEGGGETNDIFQSGIASRSLVAADSTLPRDEVVTSGASMSLQLPTILFLLLATVVCRRRFANVNVPTSITYVW